MRRRLVSVISHHLTADLGALRVMTERGLVVTCILQRLTQCILEMQSVVRCKTLACNSQLHGRNVRLRESERLEIGEAPVGLTQLGRQGDRMAVGTDGLGKPTRRLEGVAITHPDLCLIRIFFQHRGVGFQRLGVIAQIRRDRSLQIAITWIARFDGQQEVNLTERQLRLRLTKQHHRVVVSRSMKTGCQLEAALEQSLCIGITPQTGTHFGEHAQGGHVRWELSEMLTQERLSGRQLVSNQGVGSGHQTRVGVSRLEEARARLIGLRGLTRDIEMVR